MPIAGILWTQLKKARMTQWSILKIFICLWSRIWGPVGCHSYPDGRKRRTTWMRRTRGTCTPLIDNSGTHCILNMPTPTHHLPPIVEGTQTGPTPLTSYVRNPILTYRTTRWCPQPNAIISNDIKAQPACLSPVEWCEVMENWMPPHRTTWRNKKPNVEQHEGKNWMPTCRMTWKHSQPDAHCQCIEHATTNADQPRWWRTRWWCTEWCKGAPRPTPTTWMTWGNGTDCWHVKSQPPTLNNLLIKWRAGYWGRGRLWALPTHKPVTLNIKIYLLEPIART